MGVVCAGETGMADFVKGKRQGRDGGETDGGGETGVTVPDLQPLGNAAVAASLPQQAAPGAAAACGGYEVQQGDTLWDIARRHLGDGSRWQEIYDRNVGEVGDKVKFTQKMKWTMPEVQGLGEFACEVQLHPEVSQKVKVDVQPEK